MKNKGFSLVELIIFITILGIIGGGSLLYLRLGTGSEVKAVYRKIAYSIENTKQTAMGKDEASLELKKEANGDLVVIVKTIVGSEIAERKEVIGNDKISVYYSTQPDGAGSVLLSKGNSIYFTFDRSSGALKGGNPIQYILVEKESDHSYQRVLRIYKETGKLLLQD